MTPRATNAPGAFETPRLDVRWQGRRANFVESVRAAFSGPRAPRHIDPAASFFRLRIAPRRPPGRGIAASFLWHVVLLAICIPLSRMAMPKPKISLPQIEITWYGPTTDVAPTPSPKPKPKETKPAPRPKPLPKRRILARAYNPKTTVIYNPPRPTNRRQVLIQSEAPPAGPKFLPAMPNIISWAETAPVRPEIAVNSADLLARRRREAAAMLKAPEIVNGTPPAGPLDIAPSDDEVKPPLPIAPSAVMARRTAAPRTSAAAAPSLANAAPDSKPLALEASAGPQPPLPPTSSAARAERSKSATADASAPNLTVDARRLVALSLSPGAAPPPPVNASAPISIGPHVAGKVNSAAAPDLSANAASGAGTPGMPSANAAHGPEGLLILHDSSGPKPVSPPPPPAPRPLPKIAPVAPFSPRKALPRRRPAKPASKSSVVPNDLAHQVLGPWRIHTLLMNLPNLTSSSGSWILNFAEPLGKKMRESNQIIAPLPTHTVDPEYPPSEIEQGVQGTVILVAVIGVDGKVSQIRVVQSLDPVLDHNASVALSQWKFDPALLHKKPVALQVLVTVPFHFTTTPH